MTASSSSANKANDPLPDAYQRWRASRLGQITDALERDLILELCGKVDGMRVLDAGCGDGDLALALARRGAIVTGLDRDRRMLARARQRVLNAGAVVDLVEGDLQTLPFEDGRFDVVAAVAVLCLVPDAEGAVREMARVLRPGGRLVVGELGRRSLWAAIRRVRGWLGASTWRHARFWTPQSLRALVERAGLNCEVVRGAVFYPPAGWIASLMRRQDAWLGRRGQFGAAFLALEASKPSQNRTAPPRP